MQSLFFYTPFSDLDTADTEHIVRSCALSLLGLESPAGALYTGLYGVSSNRKAFSYMDAIYREQGQRCCAVSVDFDFDVYPLLYTSIEERGTTVDILISQTNVLNTLRLRPDLKAQVKAQWNSLVATSVPTIKPVPTHPFTETKLIDSLLENYPKVELIVYQVMSPVGLLSVASVYNKKPVALAALFDIEGTIILG